MISHKYRCIFIHIPKCAGSSVEKAFELYNPSNIANYDSVTGWCDKNKFLMQHATPQQLIDADLITMNQWESYYKFIIYRNSWSKSLSDYMYLYETSNILGGFSEYLNSKGEYYDKLHPDNSCKSSYEGSHLLKQKDFFYLNNELITYDACFSLKGILSGFDKVVNNLGLDVNFFKVHVNKTKNKIKHYSFFYNNKRKKLIKELYKEDIEFFNFKFEDEKNTRNNIISNLNSKFIIKNIKLLNLIK